MTRKEKFISDWNAGLEPPRDLIAAALFDKPEPEGFTREELEDIAQAYTNWNDPRCIRETARRMLAALSHAVSAAAGGGGA